MNVAALKIILFSAIGVVLAGWAMNALRDVDVVNNAISGFDS